VLTDSTKSAAIYYTLDVSAPSNKSSVYKSTLIIAKTTTLKAVAEAPGFANSAIASAKYTIHTP